MAINLDISPRFSDLVDASRLRRAALSVLEAEHLQGQSLTIVIQNDTSMRTLNKSYLDIDAPTDVLSFTSDEEDYLGDVVISYETARRNARTFKWSPKDELDLLVVHGILHLAGYDDSNARARHKMWKRQDEILGVALNGAPSHRPRGRTR